MGSNLKLSLSAIFRMVICLTVSVKTAEIKCSNDEMRKGCASRRTDGQTDGQIVDGRWRMNVCVNG